MSRKNPKRQLWRYTIQLAQGIETWELRETASHRWYFYKEGFFWGWSFMQKRILKHMFEVLKTAGGIVVKREILNVEVPPRAKNRREPIRKPKPEHLEDGNGWFEQGDSKDY